MCAALLEDCRNPPGRVRIARAQRIVIESPVTKILRNRKRRIVDQTDNFRRQVNREFHRNNGLYRNKFAPDTLHGGIKPQPRSGRNLKHVQRVRKALFDAPFAHPDPAFKPIA